jgi:hypothetical protein
MYMCHKSLTPLLRILFVFIGIQSIALAQSDCKLRKNEDGIKVYTCNTDTSNFKSIKVECTLNSSLDKLEFLLLDSDNYTLWQYNTTESKVLKKISDSEFVYYSRIEAPWPVSDRDMVVRIRSMRTSNELKVSAISEQGTLSEKKDLIRVPASNSQWIVREKDINRLEVNYSIQIDPGGNIPVWLINWVCANAPLQSFQALKKLIEEKK